MSTGKDVGWSLSPSSHSARCNVVQGPRWGIPRAQKIGTLALGWRLLETPGPTCERDWTVRHRVPFWPGTKIHELTWQRGQNCRVLLLIASSFNQMPARLPSHFWTRIGRTRFLRYNARPKLTPYNVPFKPHWLAFLGRSFQQHQRYEPWKCTRHAISFDAQGHLGWTQGEACIHPSSIECA